MAVRVASHWLTAVRLGRLGQALRLIPSAPASLPRDEVTRTVWHNCGGAYDEVGTLFSILLDLDLISVSADSYRRTNTGSKLSRLIRAGDHREFGLVFIRAGCFHDQGRLLIESGKID